MWDAGTATGFDGSGRGEELLVLVGDSLLSAGKLEAERDCGFTMLEPVACAMDFSGGMATRC